MTTRVLSSIALICLASRMACSAEEMAASPVVAPPVTAAASSKPLYIVTVGDISADLMARVASHLQESLLCEISSSTQQVALAQTPELLDKALSPLAAQSTFGLIAIVDSGTNTAYTHAIEMGDRVALIVTQRLSGQVGDATDPAENLARNVEREACYAGARLLGMPPCLMPLCALCESPENKGRNLCPPCQGKLADLLRAKGLEPVQP